MSPPPEVIYRIDPSDSQHRGSVSVEVLWRGSWANGTPRLIAFRGCAADAANDLDARMLALIAGGNEAPTNGYDLHGPPQAWLEPIEHYDLLEELCDSGRLRIWGEGTADRAVVWDSGVPWVLALQFTPPADDGSTLIRGVLRSGSEIAELNEPLAILQSGLMIFPDRIGFHSCNDSQFDLMMRMQRSPPLRIPAAEIPGAVAQLRKDPDLPLILPPSLTLEVLAPQPIPQLRFERPPPSTQLLQGVLSFAYEDWVVRSASAEVCRHDAELGVRIDRNPDLEATHRNFLKKRAPTGGARSRDGHWLEVTRVGFPALVTEFAAAGWEVFAEERRLQPASATAVRVHSGTDWFELDARVNWGEQATGLVELLACLRKEVAYVRLDDGTLGLLPEEWLARFVPLARIGKFHDGQLRLRHSHALLAEACLEGSIELEADSSFTALRSRLRAFTGARAEPEPAGFCGELRDYQRQALGWLTALASLGLGGCLADDMGLGKTVQVLAHLQGLHNRRDPQHSARAALIVAPRSLVHHWIAEAGRFTPQLRVRDHSGPRRSDLRTAAADCDVLVTTYGVLRRDREELREVPFSAVIFDEAQAVKNARSAAARAASELQAVHRLALSGTPIENHLGELATIMELVNPGLLPPSLRRRGELVGPHHETLLRMVLPFILRRTKEQVLSSLPPKTELTLTCELSAPERRLYDELRAHLLEKLATDWRDLRSGESRFLVLEALLRLRQAACHAGLLDARLKDAPSAKLILLAEKLDEILEEGHKALVFSQFTGLLALVREQLDARGRPYEYLDGQTRDRARRVAHFQEDPDCRLFVISLKAGGLGLNLTAADYVFILDPWWNPAVEAQAVDRVHRIGQDRPVFAYRLVAAGTIEEKITQLQASKRALAEAILGDDRASLATLTREDLEQILG